MEEEISLREIIEVMLRGKRLIIGITVVAMLVAVIITFIPKPSPTPTYRAESKIRIDQLSRESFKPSTGGYYANLITALMNAEHQNAEDFAELIRHPVLQADVRSELLLDERGIGPDFLARNLVVEVDADNTALTISLTHTDPIFAQEIVNTVSDKLRQLLADHQRERIYLVAGNLERLIALELTVLQSTLERLQNTRNNYDPLITYGDGSHVTPEYNVLSSDIAHTISQIAQLEAQQEVIKDFRVQVPLVLHSLVDWVIFTQAQVTDVTPEPELTLMSNIIIAGILGFMISVFIVFFLNHWKESAPTTVAK